MTEWEFPTGVNEKVIEKRASTTKYVIEADFHTPAGKMLTLTLNSVSDLYDIIALYNKIVKYRADLRLTIHIEVTEK